MLNLVGEFDNISFSKDVRKLIEEAKVKNMVSWIERSL